MRVIKFQFPVISWIFILLDIFLLAYEVFAFFFKKGGNNQWFSFLLLLTAIGYNSFLAHLASLWVLMVINIAVLILVLLKLFRWHFPSTLNEGDIPVKHPSAQLEEPTTIFDKNREYNLSAREIEVVQLLAKGMTYREIAATLFISYYTVDSHIQKIYTKVGVRNKVELLNKLGK